MLCLVERPEIREDTGMAEDDGLHLRDVTLGEVYRMLLGMRDDLGRFVAREVHEEQMRGVNARLGKLEKFMWAIVSTMVIGIVAAILIAVANG